MTDNLKNLIYRFEQQDNIQILYHYFKNKNYIVVFKKQLIKLASNLDSIKLLIDNNFIEDAFTIFRKYLETYFVLLSVFEHPEIVNEYLEHDKYLGLKACKKGLNLVRAFCNGKPEGYLEYGYLERFVEDEEDFKYTTRFVAKIARVEQFHYLYKMSNNFVHNNLTSVNMNLEDGKNVLINSFKDTTNFLVGKIEMILKQIAPSNHYWVHCIK